jgi:hypothetical protein
VITGCGNSSCKASDGYARERAVSVNFRQERSGTFRPGAGEELNTGPALSDASRIHEDDPVYDPAERDELSRALGIESTFNLAPPAPKPASDKIKA